MSVFSELREGIRLRRQPRRFGLLFFLAFSLCMVVFSLYGAQASVFEKARETVMDVFEPVLGVFSVPSRWIGDRVGNVEDYFRIHAENRRLREENAELRVWMQDALSLRRQLSYYEALLDTQMPEPARFIDASVIGETGGPFDHALFLSAGRQDGVTAGQAVVDDGGLLGHVVTVGGSAARVLLITDFESRVPVFIEDLRVEALLAGRSSGAPVLEVFSDRREFTIPVGTRIVTSGADGRLPRGLPVGEVIEVRGDAAYVAPFANIRTPDLVRVVDYTFPTNVEGEGGDATGGDAMSPAEDAETGDGAVAADATGAVAADG